MKRKAEIQKAYDQAVEYMQLEEPSGFKHVVLAAEFMPIFFDSSLLVLFTVERPFSESGD